MPLCTFLIVFHFCFTLAINSDLCEFVAGCSCIPYQDMVTVKCLGVTTFPNFDIVTDDEISYVIVQGSFPSIPANAFYNLKNINFGIILNSTQNEASVTIDETSFKFYRNYPISVSFYNFKNMSKIPTIPLQNNQSFSYLHFENGNIAFIEDYDFVGVTVNLLEFVNCGLIGAENLTVTIPNGLRLNLQQNSIKGLLPGAVYTDGLVAINLSNNQINQIPDFAFACPLPPCGRNSSLQEIDLSSNSLGDCTFGAAAFFGLPNLIALSLQDLSLTVIPTITTASCNISLLQPVASSLQSLDLSFNSITAVPANSFDGFTSLRDLNLNGNGVISIDRGAFSGMGSMKTLILDNMDALSDLDLLITSGMKSVQTLNLAYSALEIIQLGDPALIPETLTTVSVAYNKLLTIDVSVAGWLNQTDKKILDISGNDMFICSDGLKWMANYVVCIPQQIISINANCNNDGKSLVDYLQAFANCSK